MRIILILFCFSFLSSQGQTSQDTTAIRMAALNYVEGFYTADSVKIKAGVHSELVKRIIQRNQGAPVISSMSRSQLIKISVGRKKMPDKNPNEPFMADVIIYDISNGIASAKVSTNKMSAFFDYLLLGQINGEWKVIDVLWAFKNVKP